MTWWTSATRDTQKSPVTYCSREPANFQDGEYRSTETLLISLFPGPVGFHSSGLTMGKGMFTSIGMTLGLLQPSPYTPSLAQDCSLGNMGGTGTPGINCYPPSTPHSQSQMDCSTLTTGLFSPYPHFAFGSWFPAAHPTTESPINYWVTKQLNTRRWKYLQDTSGP